MELHAVVSNVKGDFRHVQEIVGKVPLDDAAFVTAADNEVIHPVSGVNLHYVPEDRAATDLDHRFRHEMRFSGDGCTETACKDDSFHMGSARCLN
jgi:hypothetical protein